MYDTVKDYLCEICCVSEFLREHGSYFKMNCSRGKKEIVVWQAMEQAQCPGLDD